MKDAKVDLRIGDLRFAYGNFSSDFLINIPRCEMTFRKGLAIFGKTGSGKTTLAKLLSGILKPEKGDLFLRTDGRKIPVSEIRYSPQFPERLFFLRRIEQTVEYISEFGDRTGYEDRFKEILYNIHLDYAGFRNRYLDQLSGGEIRLIALSLILATDARCYILDEPFIGISRFYRDKLLQLFHDMMDAGKFFMVIAHEISLIKNLFKSILILESGEIRFAGELDLLPEDKNLQEKYGFHKFAERALLMKRKRGKF